MPIKRVFNVKKDVEDKRDHLALRSLRKLPASINLLSKLGPVRDQGQSGSCTGQAGAGFMDWLYREFAQYFPIKDLSDPFFSALFLYAEERMKDGSFPADDGSDSRTIFRVLNQIGICLDSINPFSDTLITSPPSDEMILNGESFKIGAYHRILIDQGMYTMKSVLASGYCCTIGVPVYQAIEGEKVAKDGMLPIPHPNESPVGGHEMLVYGYDDRLKKGAFKVRNSWGDKWGLSGNLLIPYDYFKAAGGNDTCDGWVGHLGAPWK